MIAGQNTEQGCKTKYTINKVMLKFSLQVCSTKKSLSRRETGFNECAACTNCFEIGSIFWFGCALKYYMKSDFVHYNMSFTFTIVNKEKPLVEDTGVMCEYQIRTVYMYGIHDYPLSIGLSSTLSYKKSIRNMNILAMP